MQIPNDKIIDDKNLLTEKYNIWRDQLLQRVSDWKQAEILKQKDPAFVFRNQNGQAVSVMDVCEARKAMVGEAAEYVQVLETLRKALENGTLQDLWKEEDLKPLPTITIPAKKNS